MNRQRVGKPERELAESGAAFVAAVVGPGERLDDELPLLTFYGDSAPRTIRHDAGLPVHEAALAAVDREHDASAALEFKPLRSEQVVDEKLLLVFRAAQRSIEDLRLAVDFAEPVGVPFVHLRVVREEPREIGVGEFGDARAQELGIAPCHATEAEFRQRPDERRIFLSMNFGEVDDLEPRFPPGP